MAFPDDQNNLSTEPVPLTGNQSVAWAQLVVNWIRNLLVPAIKGMVAPINTAKSNAGTALTTAQARMQTDLSNVQKTRAMVENFTNGAWTATGQVGYWHSAQVKTILSSRKRTPASHWAVLITRDI